MQSEKTKQRNVEDESSDQDQRCGRIHSSEEIAVMAVERRNSVIFTTNIKQPEMGGFDEGRKVV